MSRRILDKRGFRALLSEIASFVTVRLRIAQSEGDTVELHIAGRRLCFETPDIGGIREVDYIERHEQEVLSDLLAELREDDVFFDVGANIGVYACFASTETIRGETVAFEPNPFNMVSLLDNVERNNANVTVHNLALADETIGPVTPLYSLNPGRIDGSSSIFDDDLMTAPYHVGVAVPDKLVAGKILPQPTVIKIDVEGAELHVLRGMADLLEAPECRIVYVEVHLGEINTVEANSEGTTEVRQILEGKGFETKAIVDRDTQKIIKAKRV